MFLDPFDKLELFDDSVITEEERVKLRNQIREYLFPFLDDGIREEDLYEFEEDEEE